MATKALTSAREARPISSKSATINSAADLRKFFKACDLREQGRELDWEDHLKAMEESRSQRGPSHNQKA